MSAGKYQHIALHRAHAAQNPIGTRTNLRGNLAARAAIAKQLPIRGLRVDFGSPKALVFAIVPFNEVRIFFGDTAKAGQFGCVSSALQWTREYFRKREACQTFSQLTGFRFSLVGQRQISQAGMLATAAPGSFAMPRQVNHREMFGHVER
jgi:hypothetical protein